MFIKIIFEDSIKFKRIRNYVSKCNLFLYFLIQKNFLISCEKMLMSTELKECITLFIHFLDLLQARYNCAKLHHCTISVTDFRKGFFFGPPICEQSPKKPIQNRVNVIRLPGRRCYIKISCLIKLVFVDIYTRSVFSYFIKNWLNSFLV